MGLPLDSVHLAVFLERASSIAADLDLVILMPSGCCALRATWRLRLLVVMLVPQISTNAGFKAGIHTSLSLREPANCGQLVKILL
jgi:hypothetical protein